MPLTGGDLRWYEGRRRYAKELIRPGTKCGDFLAANFEYTEVARALDAQRPYDGLRSTITLKQAGIVSPGYDSPVIPGYDADEALREIANRPVYKHLVNDRAAAAINNPATRYEVYFNPRKMTANTLIHEALHSATRLYDTELAERLTGITFNNWIDASIAISEVLALNGCGRY